MPYSIAQQVPHIFVAPTSLVGEGRNGVLRLLQVVYRKSIVLDHHTNGRPYIAGEENAAISISHSKGYIAVSIDHVGVPGVDVEEKHEQAQRLLPRYALPQEIELCTKANIQAIVLWSAKEAIYKCYSEILKGFSEEIVLQGVSGRELHFTLPKVHSKNFSRVTAFHAELNETTLLFCSTVYRRPYITLLRNLT